MKNIITLFLFFFSLFSFSQTIGITPFASGLASPVDITHAGDSRLFIVQQGGAIKVVNSNGSVNATNFLTLTTATIATGGERGLLGLAFHPNYSTNGYFYVNYTRAGDGDTVIARYSVSSGNANVADPASSVIILTVDQPFSNHNGGTIKFGPDGYLYVGMGDGGSGGDPENRAQNITDNLGKMLRLDVDAATPYIPADNPYVGIAGNDEIWALGLRNPWKFSFDSSNGDLWIADVGQNNIEEINRVSSTGSNLNYGWKCYEGNAVHATCTAPTTYTFPLAQYTHSGTGGCSVTGGYVYNGSLYPNFTGKYFFADYCLNRIGTVDAAGTIVYSATFAGSNNFTSFGVDINKELYVCSGSTVYRVIDTSLATNDFSTNGISLYPNPAGSEVFIRNSSETSLTKFNVYDLSGKKVIEETLAASEINSINTGSLQAGLYLVTVEDATGAKFSSKLTIK